MTCAILAFIYTYLDPFAWWTRLRGFEYEASGHLDGPERYELRGEREYELTTCTRCGRESEVGWRPAWRRA